jgi:hypothetical protein
MKIKSIPPVKPEGFPLDDWNREIPEDELWKRLHRVSGDCKCEICGNLYYNHPDETRILDWDGNPYLKRLCFGWFGKL